MEAIGRRAFSYCRVSCGAQVQRGEGLQRQVERAEAWAAANGIPLDASLDLSDPGRSASKGHHLKEGAALHRFLKAAKAGELGPSPILLIEDFTRLSRLEPLDSLDRVVSPLVRAGVEIITLEDGATYDLERLNRDPASLLVLVVKAQAAADYARKLSGYILDRRAKDRAAILAGEPVCTGWAPSWIEWDATTDCWRFTPYEATVRRLVALSWEHGTTVVCRTLNAEGHLSPGGRPWSQRPVGSILRNPALHGARRIARPGHANDVKDWQEECARLIERHRAGVALPPKPKRTYEEAPNTFPAILTADEHAALLAAVRVRLASPNEKGRRDRTHFVGQGLSICICGGPIGVRSVKPRKRSGLPGDARYIYLQCRARERGQSSCNAPPIRVEPVHAHLLTRLQEDALAQAVASGSAGGELQALLSRHAALAAELATAEARAANAATALRAGALSGTAVLAVYEEAVAEAAGEVEAARSKVAEAAVAIRDREHRPSGEEAAGAVQDLLQSFARDTDTPEQRRSVNTMLRKLGITITVDATEQRIGLQIADGPLSWEPLAPKARRLALETGRINPERAVDHQAAGKVIPVVIDVRSGTSEELDQFMGGDSDEQADGVTVSVDLGWDEETPQVSSCVSCAGPHTQH